MVVLCTSAAKGMVIAMKILKTVMLALLVSLCATAAVITAVHLFGGSDSDGDVRVGRDRPARIASDDTIDADVPEEDVMEERRMLQRAVEKPDGSDYWHYYPMIPYDAVIGDTVVLSATVDNFVNWEIEGNLEYTEEKDDELAYISFILPEDDFEIIALYNEVPFNNFRDPEYVFGNYRSSSLTEEGAPDAFIRMPNARVGEIYNIDLGVLLPTGTIEHLTSIVGGVNWQLRTSEPLDNPLPAGLFFERIDRPIPLLSTGRILGTPTTPQVTTTYTILITYATSRPPWTDDEGITHPGWSVGDTVDIILFGLAIWDRLEPPDFYPTPADGIPDGMQNVPYDQNFYATDLPLPEGTTWVWTIDGTLPPGMRLDNINMHNALLTGTPTVSQTLPFTFTIVLSTDNTDFADVRKTYTITIWPQPTITPAVPLPAAGGPVLPNLYDGIANAGMGYEVVLNAPGDTTSPTGTKWTWSYRNGYLPDGLDLFYATDTSVTITGPDPLTVPGTFSFTIRYTADPSVLIGWEERDFIITIQAPPSFETGFDELLPTMHSIPRYTNEPPDAPTGQPVYTDTISVYKPVIDSRTEWEWEWYAQVGSWLPPGLGLTTIDDTFGIISGNPTTDTSRDYLFDIELTADSTNPNIDGAVVSDPFKIRIWERRYLYIDFEDSRNFVRRLPGVNEAGDDNWDDLNLAPAIASPYQMKRAVMPGNNGEIRVQLGSSGFVRWELVENPVDNLGDPVSNANGFASIGGPSAGAAPGYNFVPANSHAFLRVTMPSFAPDGTTSIDGDVYIRGVDTRSPSWTTRPRAPSPAGMVGDEDSSGFVTFGAADVGDGAGQISWRLIPGTGTLPPGMYFTSVNNNVLTIMSEAGGPLIDGTFTFTLGITLRGGMEVLSVPISMLIEPIPGILLGDVNGDGQRNLADLVLLARFVRKEPGVYLPNMEAGNIVSNAPDEPNLSDLEILAIFFGREQATLTQQQTEE